MRGAFWTKLSIYMIIVLCIGMTAQADVLLPSMLVEIDEYAFHEDASLSGHLEIPEGTESIGMRSFLNCTGLTSVTIPESVKYIGFEAFYGCTGLTGTVYISSDAEVGENAFGGCPDLTVVRMSLAEAVMAELEYVVHEEGFVEITSYDGSLTKVVIPETIEGLPVEVVGGFAGNEIIVEIVLPDTVTLIAEYAFNECTALEKINIPSSLTALGAYAFAGCNALKGPYTFVDVEDVVFGFFGNEVTQADRYTTLEDGTLSWNGICNPPAHIVVPEQVGGRTVTEIDSWYMSRYNHITQVTMPDTITRIAPSAFYGCASLEQINIPAGVEEIGYNAFAECTSLAKLSIPDSVRTMGSGAFRNCSALTGTIGFVDVQDIEFVFSGCPELTVFNYSVLEDGTLSVASCVAAAKDVNVPAEHNGRKVTQIGKDCFRKLDNIETLILSEGITCISNWAVSECPSLTTLVLPESLNRMRRYAVSDCPVLKGEYVLLDVQIETELFYECPGVTLWSFKTNGDGTCAVDGYEGTHETIAIPPAYEGMPVTAIGDKTFFQRQMKSLEMPDSLVSLGFRTFAGCTALESIRFSQALQTINENAFEECTALASIVIPDSVQVVETDAFADCTALKNVSFAETTVICYDAFDGTPWLTSLAQKVVDQVTDENDTLFDKAVAIHDWLTEECCYDLTYTYYAPEGMFLYNTGVCNAYAESYQMMLELVGIEVQFVTGTGNGGLHAWNLVKLDGDWYHVDCTWDDPIPDGSENHQYCFITDEVMARDHWWEVSDYPAATGTRYFQGKDTQK